MTVTVAITEGYCSESEADLYLVNDSVWLAATSVTKLDAIMRGRYYIDSKYVVDLDSWDVIPDEVKMANSYIASDIANGFAVLAPDNNAQVISKTIKAGSVTKAVDYAAGFKSKPPSSELISSMLIGTLDLKSSSTVSLIRA